MEKKSCNVNRNPLVKDVFERLWIGLQVEKTKKAKLDVPPPPDFSVDLPIRKEDMNKYKVGGSAPVASEDHWKNIGFGNRVNTQICVRDKSVKFSPKALQMLGRSWFKEALTEKEQRASIYVANNQEIKEDDADHLMARELLHQFLKQSEARTSFAKKKGKKVDEKRIRSTSGLLPWKKQAEFLDE